MKKTLIILFIILLMATNFTSCRRSLESVQQNNQYWILQHFFENEATFNRLVYNFLQSPHYIGNMDNRYYSYSFELSRVVPMRIDFTIRDDNGRGLTSSETFFDESLFDGLTDSDLDRIFITPRDYENNRVRMDIRKYRGLLFRSTNANEILFRLNGIFVYLVYSISGEEPTQKGSRGLDDVIYRINDNWFIQYYDTHTS